MALNIFEKNVRKMTAPGRYGGVYGAKGSNVQELLSAYNARMEQQKNARDSINVQRTSLAQQGQQDRWARDFKRDELQSLEGWRKMQDQLERDKWAQTQKSAEQRRQDELNRLEFDQDLKLKEFQASQTPDLGGSSMGGGSRGSSGGSWGGGDINTPPTTRQEVALKSKWYRDAGLPDFAEQEYQQWLYSKGRNVAQYNRQNDSQIDRFGRRIGVGVPYQPTPPGLEPQVNIAH